MGEQRIPVELDGLDSIVEADPPQAALDAVYAAVATCGEDH